MRPIAVGCWLVAALLCQGATITITNEDLPRTGQTPTARPEAWTGHWLSQINRWRAQSRKPALVLDETLSQGAAAQARLIATTPPASRSRLPSKALLEALWQSGVIDGNPVWRVVALPPGTTIAADHPAFKAIAELDASHLGLGAYRSGGTHWVVATAVQRRLELSGLKPGAYAPYASFWLRGRLLPGYRNPRLLLTPPDGTVSEKALPAASGHFEHVLELGGSQGRYMAEIMVDGPLGPVVAALLPLDVGQAATSRPAASAPRSDAAMSLPAMRQRLLELVNADRARHGLPPLQFSETLSRMAQGHSEDMARNRFFAHVSPQTGDLQARARAVGLPNQTLGENIAMAGSLEEAQENLMASPGHRAMILSPEMRYVGFGVVAAREGQGARQYWVTQNFGSKGP